MTVAPFNIGEFECLITSTTKLADTPEYLCFSINKYSRLFNGFDSGIHFKIFKDCCELTEYELVLDSDDFDEDLDYSYDTIFHSHLTQDRAIAMLLGWLNSVDVEDRMKIIEVMNTKFMSMSNPRQLTFNEIAVKGGA